jgi:hypothetical protein
MVMNARAARPLLFMALAGAPALGLLAACSNGSESSPDATPGCPTFSSSCPAMQPSFQGDVQPIFATYCLSCHGDGGIEQSQLDYSTYQGVYEHRSQIVNQVSHCTMPPLDASPPLPAPSDQERQTIIAWIACGAPNN